MTKLLFSKFFWGLLIFLGFGWYFFRINNLTLTLSDLSSLLGQDWEKSVQSIIKDCKAVNLEGEKLIDEYIFDLVDFKKEYRLIGLEQKNKEKCWLVVTEYNDNFNTGKIIYETLDGKIKTTAVKNLSLQPE